MTWHGRHIPLFDLPSRQSLAILRSEQVVVDYVREDIQKIIRPAIRKLYILQILICIDIQECSFK